VVYRDMVSCRNGNVRHNRPVLQSYREGGYQITHNILSHADVGYQIWHNILSHRDGGYQNYHRPSYTYGGYQIWHSPSEVSDLVCCSDVAELYKYGCDTFKKKKMRVIINL